MLTGPTVVKKLRVAAQEFGPREDIASLLSDIVVTEWLRQYVEPPPMPELMDAYTQEPLLLCTDHYRVSDWRALTDALAACADVQGGRDDGWNRLIERDDGQIRPVAGINPGKQAQRIEVFYTTQRYANEGRAWFDAVAGSSVKFLAREVEDPVAGIGQIRAGTAKPAGAKRGTPEIPPEALSQAIEASVRGSYANWADEPIPALGNKTPRQAMKTSAGLERVKGLIRSYEAGEEQMAQQQGRPEVSYDFLWQAIGVAP
jgi:hypothetical protein